MAFHFSNYPSSWRATQGSVAIQKNIGQRNTWMATSLNAPRHDEESVERVI